MLERSLWAAASAQEGLRGPIFTDPLRGTARSFSQLRDKFVIWVGVVTLQPFSGPNDVCAASRPNRSRIRLEESLWERVFGRS